MKFIHQLFYAVILFLLLAASIRAQTTAFTYQGKLTDNNMAASGTYEMQFRLFDTQAAGTGTCSVARKRSMRGHGQRGRREDTANVTQHHTGC